MLQPLELALSGMDPDEVAELCVAAPKNDVRLEEQHLNREQAAVLLF